MQVMRSLSFEAYLVHYLFCCFDLVQDAKLKVVQEMSNKFAAIVDSAARWPQIRGMMTLCTP